MKPKIYAFIGVIGSGKDYRMSKLQNVTVVNFKDPLVSVCNIVAGVNQEYEDFKYNVLGITSREDTDKLLKEHPGLITGRVFMQRFATEGLRSLFPNIWVELFLKRISETEGNIACGDLRFPNELMAIIQLCDRYEIIVTFCDYNSFRYDNKLSHESEYMAQQFKIFFPKSKDGDIISIRDLSRFCYYMQTKRSN